MYDTVYYNVGCDLDVFPYGLRHLTQVPRGNECKNLGEKSLPCPDIAVHLLKQSNFFFDFQINVVIL